jgi:hypothetical protein
MDFHKNKRMATVLIVDNVGAVVEIARDFLEQEGFSVLTARDGRSAINIVQEHTGTIDLCLTEEEMPEMNGLVLAQRLRLFRPAIKIIVMSATLKGHTYKKYAADLGALFLWKPFTKQELVSVVAAALPGRKERALASKGKPCGRPR